MTFFFGFSISRGGGGPAPPLDTRLKSTVKNVQHGKTSLNRAGNFILRIVLHVHHAVTYRNFKTDRLDTGACPGIRKGGGGKI